MMCDPQPFSVEQKVIPCAQDTEQKHGNHGCGEPLSSFPLILAVVLATVVAYPLSIATVSCESGTSAKLVDTSVRLVSVNLERARSSSERV